jgi:LPS O-antigen subunit length determinant protein (WzzB/FepE family)
VGQLSLFGLGVAEMALLFAAAAYVVDRVLSQFGRSATTLRAENQDLLRRNGELEQRVRELEARSAVLEDQVNELRKHSLESVMTALAHHEDRANVRHGQTLDVLERIHSTLKGVS